MSARCVACSHGPSDHDIRGCLPCAERGAYCRMFIPESQPADSDEIAEFILGRLAEDDEMVKTMAKNWPYDGGWSPEYVERFRVEMAAKRSIVQMCRPDLTTSGIRMLAETNPRAWNVVRPLVEQAEDEHDTILRLIALTWMSHPDYKQDWTA